MALALRWRFVGCTAAGAAAAGADGDVNAPPAAATLKAGESLSVRLKLTNVGAVAGADDLAALDALTEASMLGCLRARYAAAPAPRIYTAVGDILVAVNPHAPLPALYTPAAMAASSRWTLSSPRRSRTSRDWSSR